MWIFLINPRDTDVRTMVSSIRLTAEVKRGSVCNVIFYVLSLKMTRTIVLAKNCSAGCLANK